MKLFRQGLRNKSLRIWNGWLHLGILVICFSFGVVISLMVTFAGGISEELRSYLQEYLIAASRGMLKFSFASVLRECLIWPAVAIIAGCLPFAAISLPALFFMRGFLLTYASAACYGAMGWSGFTVALVLLWVTVLFLLPVLFLVGCEAMRRVGIQSAGAASSSDRPVHPEVFLCSFGLLIVAAALQWTVTPKLLSVVCSRIFF